MGVHPGQIFERLTVLEVLPKVKGERRAAKCICVCGNVRIATIVKDGLYQRSCGCLQKEIAANSGRSTATHGKRNTKVYAAWRAMINRCTNSKVESYPRYGGRGICVNKSWMKFENFYADMKDPLPGQSLDRINVNGNYEPGNCRWTDPKTQSNNRTDNHRITIGSQTKTVTEWERAWNLRKGTLVQRLKKMTPAQALLIPIDKRKSHRRKA